MLLLSHLQSVSSNKREGMLWLAVFILPCPGWQRLPSWLSVLPDRPGSSALLRFFLQDLACTAGFFSSLVAKIHIHPSGEEIKFVP